MHIILCSPCSSFQAALFVALSPVESNLPETISTLTFGSNAKQIELGRAKKNISKGKKST